MRIIYADNNATTPIAPEVYEAMIPYLTEDYFNPSSMYEPARRVAAAIAQSRQQIAGHFGLGDRKSVDVEVTFYPSGKKVTQKAVAADKTVEVRED